MFGPDGHIPEELLWAYQDDALPPEERAEVEGHLAACPACAAELSEMGSLMIDLRALPLERAPEGFLDGVRARVEASERAWWRLPWLRAWLRPGRMTQGLVVAFATVTVIVVVLRSPEADRMEPDFRPEVASAPAARQQKAAAPSISQERREEEAMAPRRGDGAEGGLARDDNASPARTAPAPADAPAQLEARTLADKDSVAGAGIVTGADSGAGGGDLPVEDLKALGYTDAPGFAASKRKEEAPRPSTAGAGPSPERAKAVAGPAAAPPPPAAGRIEFAPEPPSGWSASQLAQAPAEATRGAEAPVEVAEEQAANEDERGEASGELEEAVVATREARRQRSSGWWESRDERRPSDAPAAEGAPAAQPAAPMADEVDALAEPRAQATLDLGSSDADDAALNRAPSTDAQGAAKPAPKQASAASTAPTSPAPVALTLRASSAPSADAVARLAAEQGGRLVSTSPQAEAATEKKDVGGESAAPPSTTLYTLSVPASRLDALLKALADLGAVTVDGPRPAAPQGGDPFVTVRLKVTSSP